MTLRTTRTLLLALALLAPKGALAAGPEAALVTVDSGRAGAPPVGGVVLSADGHVGTTLAALPDAAAASVTLADGDRYDDVRPVDVDRRRGLVLLRIKGYALPALPVADPASIAAGQSLRVAGWAAVPSWSAHRPEPTLVAAQLTGFGEGDGFRTFSVQVPAGEPVIGGAVVDDAGALVGLVTAWAANARAAIVVPARYLAGMLAVAGTELPAPVAPTAPAPVMPEPAPVAPEPAMPAAAPAPTAEPAAPPQPAYSFADVRRIAVFPFTSTGSKVDTFWTSIFMQEFRHRGFSQQLVDPYELSVRLDDGQYFHALGQMDELLADARRVGAQAVFIGEGKEYSMGFRLEVRLIEVNQGQVLWTAASASGMALSGPSAKTEDVRKALRAFPRPGRR